MTANTYVRTYECMCLCMYVCMYVHMYVCIYIYMYVYVYMYLCMYVFNFLLLFIYLQHARLHRVILHACRQLYYIYTVFTILRICLHTAYVRIVRLQFFIVNGVCKIGKLF